MTPTITSTRLHVVDALRGFAIISIMLLHNIEHFDFYFIPLNQPEWLIGLNKIVWDSLFFLFGGKSYEIFALLFGLTFFIQSDNQNRKGKDFRARFGWRLILLLVFGLINSAFYQGDILTIYAILGFSLIPIAKLSNKAVFIIAIVLMLQPLELFNLISGIILPQEKLADPQSWLYFSKTENYLAGNSIVNTWIGNLTNGKMAVMYWTWEAGRVFQTCSLFMLGMLAGRTKLFVNTSESQRFWIRTIILSSLAFIVLNFISTNFMKEIQAASIKRPFKTLISSWSNFSFMLILVSGFVMTFWKYAGKGLNIFSSLGKMSLSNYIFQSIAGSFIYYGFGWGLYQYTGASICLLIGIALAVIQGIFSNWWMKNHKQGPLETIWHKLTWLKM